MGKLPHKMTKLVVSAIRNLRDVQGSTTKDILNYVMREYNSEPSMERRLRAALKRGIEYGILQKKGGHYLLNTDTEILTDQDPMERGKRRRRRRRKGGRKGRKGRGRRRRRGGRRRGKSKGRKARRRSRRGARHHRGRGKTMRKRGGVDDMDMLAKEPLEAAAPRTGVDTIMNPVFDRPRSRSRSRHNRQSRSRTPSHSRSSDSSDREAANGHRQKD